MSPSQAQSPGEAHPENGAEASVAAATPGSADEVAPAAPVIVATADEVPPAAPAIVVRGSATPEEVAALVAVLSAVGGGEPPASDRPSSTWAAHSAGMRPAVSHGPGAWRTALRP